MGCCCRSTLSASRGRVVAGSREPPALGIPTIGCRFVRCPREPGSRRRTPVPSAIACRTHEGLRVAPEHGVGYDPIPLGAEQPLLDSMAMHASRKHPIALVALFAGLAFAPAARAHL